MKRTTWLSGKILAIIILSAIMIAAVACSTNSNTTPTVSPTPTASTPAGPTAPSITIISPTGNVPQIGNVNVSVQVSNFTLVDKLGKANAAGEGHIHYFMDVDAPTTAGSPAITAPGTYAATSATNYTWHNVGGGSHKFSVELANNDHTPLNPPVTATVQVLVVPNIGPPSMVILTPRDGAIVPAGNVTVTAQVSNFNPVSKLGGANVSREGHFIYYLDVDAPSVPGVPATTTPGSFASTADTAYTWANLAAGTHTFSVELVNNDNTPLDPAVKTKITVTVGQ
jgi:hypothetical protein